MPKKVRFYIDGFNLYNGCLKDTPYRWLDYHALCQKILDDLPEKDCAIDKVKFFTAKLVNRGGAKADEHRGKRRRQIEYLNLLKALGKSGDVIRVIEGRYDMWPRKLLRLDEQNEVSGKRVRILHLEEKRSDVNLAVQLVRDAYRGKFDAAVVVSEDSDLQEAVRVVTEEIGRKVFVVNPNCRRTDETCCKKYGQELVKHASHERAFVVRDEHLEHSRLPDTVMRVGGGKFVMPKDWDKWQNDRAWKKRQEETINCHQGDCLSHKYP